MNRNTFLPFLLLLAIGLISCKKSDEKLDKLEIAKQYYKALDSSDDIGIVSILSDSMIVRENEDDYEEAFSQKGYIEWLKWDAVFDPTYSILEIELENGVVKSKISKIDKRISFLHTEPIVWTEIILFDERKISRVERTKYINFNVSKFIQTRDSLTVWIDRIHPELNGFLNDQTKSGGMKYLDAIELYNNRN